MKTAVLNSFLKFYVMRRTGIDLYGIAHVKVDFIPVLKMCVLPLLGKFVWTAIFDNVPFPLKHVWYYHQPSGNADWAITWDENDEHFPPRLELIWGIIICFFYSFGEPAQCHLPGGQRMLVKSLSKRSHVYRSYQFVRMYLSQWIPWVQVRNAHWLLC